MLRFNCYWKAVFVVGRTLHCAACFAGWRARVVRRPLSVVSRQSSVNQRPCIALGFAFTYVPVCGTFNIFIDARIRLLFLPLSQLFLSLQAMLVSK